MGKRNTARSEVRDRGGGRSWTAPCVSKEVAPFSVEWEF